MSNGKKGVISGKSLKAMRVPQADAGARGLMGITWFIRQIGDITAYAHGGATHGQQAYFFFIPDKDFACAILTNSDDGGIINASPKCWSYISMQRQTSLRLSKSQLGN
jgi:CubicO group peptidase (beta-lactamase class C family)